MRTNAIFILLTVVLSIYFVDARIVDLSKGGVFIQDKPSLKLKTVPVASKPINKIKTFFVGCDKCYNQIIQKKLGNKLSEILSKRTAAIQKLINESYSKRLDLPRQANLSYKITLLDDIFTEFEVSFVDSKGQTKTEKSLLMSKATHDDYMYYTANGVNWVFGNLYWLNFTVEACYINTIGQKFCAPAVYNGNNLSIVYPLRFRGTVAFDNKTAKFVAVVRFDQRVSGKFSLTINLNLNNLYFHNDYLLMKSVVSNPLESRQFMYLPYKFNYTLDINNKLYNGSLPILVNVFNKTYAKIFYEVKLKETSFLYIDPDFTITSVVQGLIFDRVNNDYYFNVYINLSTNTLKIPTFLDVNLTNQNCTIGTNPSGCNSLIIVAKNEIKFLESLSIDVESFNTPEISFNLNTCDVADIACGFYIPPGNIENASLQNLGGSYQCTGNFTYACEYINYSKYSTSNYKRCITLLSCGAGYYGAGGNAGGINLSGEVFYFKHINMTYNFNFISNFNYSIGSCEFIEKFGYPEGVSFLFNKSTGTYVKARIQYPILVALISNKITFKNLTILTSNDDPTDILTDGAIIFSKHSGSGGYIYIESNYLIGENLKLFAKAPTIMPTVSTQYPPGTNPPLDYSAVTGSLGGGGIIVLKFNDSNASISYNVNKGSHIFGSYYYEESGICQPLTSYASNLQTLPEDGIIIFGNSSVTCYNKYVSNYSNFCALFNDNTSKCTNTGELVLNQTEISNLNYFYANINSCTLKAFTSNNCTGEVINLTFYANYYNITANYSNYSIKNFCYFYNDTSFCTNNYYLVINKSMLGGYFYQGLESEGLSQQNCFYINNTYNFDNTTCKQQISFNPIKINITSVRDELEYRIVEPINSSVRIEISNGTNVLSFYNVSQVIYPSSTDWPLCGKYEIRVDSLNNRYYTSKYYVDARVNNTLSNNTPLYTIRLFMIRKDYPLAVLQQIKHISAAGELKGARLQFLANRNGTYEVMRECVTDNNGECSVVLDSQTTYIVKSSHCKEDFILNPKPIVVQYNCGNIKPPSENESFGELVNVTNETNVTLANFSFSELLKLQKTKLTGITYWFKPTGGLINFNTLDKVYGYVNCTLNCIDYATFEIVIDGTVVYQETKNNSNRSLSFVANFNDTWKNNKTMKLRIWLKRNDMDGLILLNDAYQNTEVAPKNLKEAAKAFVSTWGAFAYLFIMGLITIIAGFFARYGMAVALAVWSISLLVFVALGLLPAFLVIVIVLLAIGYAYLKIR